MIITIDVILIVLAIACLVALLLNAVPRVNWLAVAGILFLLTFLTGCAGVTGTATYTGQHGTISYTPPSQTDPPIGFAK